MFKVGKNLEYQSWELAGGLHCHHDDERDAHESNQSSMCFLYLSLLLHTLITLLLVQQFVFQYPGQL